MTKNDRPLGAPLPDWTPPARPTRAVLQGRYTALEPLEARHVADLYDGWCEDTCGAIWDYMPVGPFESEAAYGAWATDAAASQDPLFFTILNEAGVPRGVASYLRITPEAGSIEIGYITFAPSLQRQRAASEAILLMARQALALGYRRVEWKCNALNAASRRAAIRFGFSYEGVFRQATVSKGRNRDTAWFALIDTERAELEAAWSAWLDPSNFDAVGAQKHRLADLTRPIIASHDPAY